MSRTTPARVRHPVPAWVRLLLLLPVLFGFGAMHTLGHHNAPSERHPVPVAAAAVHAVPSVHDASDLPDTDPTSMCPALNVTVAALLSLTSVALLAWPGLLAPPPSWLHRLALRFAPPPLPPSLARLQVLRI
ncbi:MAG TPA: hypothetical protein VKZ89_00695 [Thermobifida alba]|nr:hypothetical protein [Thermobifida alba]